MVADPHFNEAWFKDTLIEPVILREAIHHLEAENPDEPPAQLIARCQQKIDRWETVEKRNQEKARIEAEEAAEARAEQARAQAEDKAEADREAERDRRTNETPYEALVIVCPPINRPAAGPRLRP